jgi:hypothetical protein
MPTPTQELITKDLHGSEWRFKHIYRGMYSTVSISTEFSIFMQLMVLNSARPTPSAPSDYWMEHVCHIKEADCW